MGYPTVGEMAEGLRAVRDLSFATHGTLTIDSYTRLGKLDLAALALSRGRPLNGFPLLSHPVDVVRRMVDDAGHPDFTIQVRHGSPDPGALFRRMTEIGLTRTEGGPLSYCLPYSRVPVSVAVDRWRSASRVFAAANESASIETFGGCMLGQMCPPGMLVAISVLEGLFFQQLGFSSISLSLTQQTSPAQDVAALRALRRIGGSRLTTSCFDVVLYMLMGQFPRTRAGYVACVREAVHIARAGGADRVIVKTQPEAVRLPSLAENVDALRLAAGYDEDSGQPVMPESEETSAIEADALLIIDRTMELSSDIGQALCQAVHAGMLDIPYCLHPDNQGLTTARLDGDGRVVWTNSGLVPVTTAAVDPVPASSMELLRDLSFARRRYDEMDDLHGRK